MRVDRFGKEIKVHRVSKEIQKLRGLVLVVSGSRRFGYLRGIVLALGTRGRLTVIANRTGGVNLVDQILVLRLIKKFLLVLVGNDLGAINQQNDPAGTDTESPRTLHL